MEQQLPLFARELTPADQQTVREALTLLEGQLREPSASFAPSSHAVRDWLRVCSLLRWSGKSLPRSFSITSIA